MNNRIQRKNANMKAKSFYLFDLNVDKNDNHLITSRGNENEIQ